VIRVKGHARRIVVDGVQYVATGTVVIAPAGHPREREVAVVYKEEPHGE
jgi:hypothetical protein